MQARVIIGANFGDEGKGLFTDYAVSQCSEQALVIRYNGGAQAGHTVTTPDGKRHVFSHFGSGTLLGAPTYLSRFFVCNPLLFLREWGLLRTTPMVFAAPQCPVTTPYDMMINQIVEEVRGRARHGSCGVGFGETLERHARPQFALTVGDLSRRGELIRKLYLIRTQWLPERLHAVGVMAPPSPEWTRRLASEETLQNFLRSCDEFLGRITPAGIELLSSYGNLVFEGAQGLLLDQDHEWFPHVTRSSTGLRNVIALAEEADIRQLDVTYATRAYLTRHGAGPLMRELGAKPYEAITDATNIPNAYQGSLRFAHLDLDLLEKTVHRDLSLAGRIKITPRLGVSCMDQLEDEVTYYSRGVRHEALPEELVEDALEHLNFKRADLSFGPTRRTIESYRLASSSVRYSALSAAESR